MGIYMFNTQMLIGLLKHHSGLDDFGRDIIPEAIKSHQVYGFDFDGYWEDIGTIRSFYEKNLKLTDDPDGRVPGVEPDGVLGDQVLRGQHRDVLLQTEVGVRLDESWDVSPDQLTWTFHLRRGAAFSDGRPITADDVLFSFAVLYDKALHPPGQDRRVGPD